MIEITKEEAEKHNAILVQDIYGAEVAIISGVPFVINPRVTEYQKSLDDDQTTSISA